MNTIRQTIRKSMRQLHRDFTVICSGMGLHNMPLHKESQASWDNSHLPVYTETSDSCKSLCGIGDLQGTDMERLFSEVNALT